MAFEGLFWDPVPWQELHREGDRVFGSPQRPRPSRTVHYPPVNVWAGEEDLVATAEIPGVDVNELDIAVEDDRLTIRGKRRIPQPGKGERYHRFERSHGAFARALTLPCRVESSKVSASYKDGVLTITLPMADDDKPRKIAVTT